jgi:transcriptional regulator with XRE-family HTH domain
MESEAWVQLALAKLSCTQKELAARVGVSPTQISKWKSGDYLSTEMENKFRELVKIDSYDPSVVIMSGSLDAARWWDKLIHHLADLADDFGETGYDTYPLQDEDGRLLWSTFYTLKNMGVELPKEFPRDLMVDYDHMDEGESEILRKNPYSNLIQEIFESLTNLWGFYTAYVSEITEDDELDLFEIGSEMESCMMDLAAIKCKVELSFAPKIKELEWSTKKNYQKWIEIVKDKAFRAGVPLRAELLRLIGDSSGELGHAAEAEALGFNKSRLHPDVYMNELLVGMRVLHQVLPKILEKLGIEDFGLDTSELSIG